jgi:outer membrane lipoprotein-sorting protein
MISHERMKEQLVSLALGELSEPRRSEVEAHAVTCDECRVELRRINQLLACAGRRRALSADEPLHESARSGLRVAVSREPEPKTTARPLRRRAFPWRTIMTSSTAKLAVAAVVVVAAVFGIYMLTGSQPAFADVVRPILTAQTAAYKIVAHVEGQPTVTVEAQFMAPGKVRQIMSFGEAGEAGGIQIVDYQQGKGLVLVPTQKMAMAMELKNAPEQSQAAMYNPFETFRDLIQKAQANPGESIRYLGESRIDSRKVVGYRVTVAEATVMAHAGQELTIWADAASLLPVQVECSLEKMYGKPGTMTMSDIQFDVPLDPAEFSLAVPEGYTQRTLQVDASRPTEADLIETLRVWTEATGKFPAQLNLGAGQEVFKALRDKGQQQLGENPSPDDPGFKAFLQLFQRIMRGLTFVTTLPPEADSCYLGADATFGDATRPVFWYRPAGSATYRVIYADLSVLDVAFEDLPK